MKLMRVWQLRKGSNLTAWRLSPVWWDVGVDDDNRLNELRRRLFKVQYPKADKRVKAKRKT